MYVRSTLILAALAVAALPALYGCDETVSHREKTEVTDDGTRVHKEETVKQKDDGTIVKEEQKSVDRP